MVKISHKFRGIEVLGKDKLIMVIVKRGSNWILYTKDRKRILGKFKTKKAALKRERQIIFFKHLSKR